MPCLFFLSSQLDRDPPAQLHLTLSTWKASTSHRFACTTRHLSLEARSRLSKPPRTTTRLSHIALPVATLHPVSEPIDLLALPFHHRTLAASAPVSLQTHLSTPAHGVATRTKVYNQCYRGGLPGLFVSCVVSAFARASAVQRYHDILDVEAQPIESR